MQLKDFFELHIKLLKLIGLLPADCDIHVLYGVDIGRTLQNDKSCHNVFDHIGNKMHVKIYKIIFEKNTVLIDEATSISKKIHTDSI